MKSIICMYFKVIPHINYLNWFGILLYFWVIIYDFLLFLRLQQIFKIWIYIFNNQVIISVSCHSKKLYVYSKINLIKQIITCLIFRQIFYIGICKFMICWFFLANLTSIRWFSIQPDKKSRSHDLKWFNKKSLFGIEISC